ncbi:MFS transporter [Saccharomonospora sp. NPDC046836]|uniref:MFS transporter n=1 Tax=Saccharomonospora sp. NPDC046836 TaxID=3156921 RepID=UPI00340317A0
MTRATATPASASARVWPLYAGGFLGPYGSTMVTPMLHEVARGLDSTESAVAAAVTAYMLPFAGLMLVSGTLAERWGRRRTMQISLVVFVLASAWCALAPDLLWFLAGRAVQGATNAFTTPLLVAAIGDLVPRERLGRALGWFGAMQAAGQAFSPLVSGLSATVDWRLAFAFPALVALVLAALPPGEEAAARRASGKPSWRALLSGQLALACALSFLCYLAAVGLTVLGTLRAQEVFGLGPAERGLVSASFGVAGILAAGSLGRWLDRLGPQAVGLVMNVLLAAGVLLAAFAGFAGLLVTGIVLAGAAVTGLRSTVNSLAVTSAPDNRGGASSVALSFQFFGGALAPAVWVPLYQSADSWGFAAGALAPVLAIILLAARRDPLGAGPR